MKKLSSYQKLKAENQRLKHDIYNLVMRDHEWEGFSIRVNYRFRFGKEGAIWYRASEMPEPGIGIMAQIKGKKKYNDKYFYCSICQAMFPDECTCSEKNELIKDHGPHK